MSSLRQRVATFVSVLALLAAGLVVASPAQAAVPSVPVVSSVPDGLLRQLLSFDQGPIVALPTANGVRFSWPGSSVEFDATTRSAVASGGGTPPLHLRSSLSDATGGASTVAGRLAIDSQPAQGRDVVYFPFDGGVATFDVLAGPASPRTVRWGVESAGQPLAVDAEVGVATLADGTVVARFDGVSAVGADGGSVGVEVRAGLGFLEMEVVGDLAPAQFPVVIDPTWNRTTKTYTENNFAGLFGAGGHKYRVRGYNFKFCIETGANCRAGVGQAGRFKPEATAQAHAIRRLAKMRTGNFAPTVPNELDWEVGKRDDITEEPPCDGTAGFRIDIVLNVKGFTDRGGKYRLIEVKNVEQVGEVEAQLACYELKLRKDKLDVGRLADLSNEGWAVTYQDDITKERWYAWAALPGYVLFGRGGKGTKVPQSVVDKAKETGRETIVLPITEGPTLPVPALNRAPVLRPVP